MPLQGMTMICGACGHLAESHHYPNCSQCQCAGLSDITITFTPPEIELAHSKPVISNVAFDLICACGHPVARHTSSGFCVYGNCSCRIELPNIIQASSESQLSAPLVLLEDLYLEPPMAKPLPVSKQAIAPVQSRGERKLALDKDI